MKLGFRLYLITDRKSTGGKDLLEVIKSALDGGLRAVCIREKDMGGKGLFRLAERVKKTALPYGAKLFINDRVDVAIGVDADGVHLGQRGFSPKEARKILAKGKLIGVSTHSMKEALKAQEDGADFITLGPIYHTPSKVIYGQPIGLKPLRMAKRVLEMPVFAIGGIKKENVKEVVSSGAYGVAVISAVIGRKDVKKSTKDLLSEINKGCIC